MSYHRIFTHNIRHSVTPLVPRIILVGLGPTCSKTTLSPDGRPRSTEWPHPVYISDRITDRKSVFLAHATSLSPTHSFSQFLDHLTASPSLKRATHCMYAYRTRQKDSPHVLVGQHDGGESGSGDRLSRLLELSGGEDVAVVVSRWYGGAKLGSDRWKRISQVAKQALDRGGYIKHGRGGQEKSKTKGK